MVLLTESGKMILKDRLEKLARKKHNNSLVDIMNVLSKMSMFLKRIRSYFRNVFAKARIISIMGNYLELVKILYR